MTPSTTERSNLVAARAPVAGTGSAVPALERVFPAVPLAATALFAAVVLSPRVGANPRLVATFLAIAALFTAWTLVLWARARASRRVLAAQYFPVTAHWVQACVQFTILVWWAWFAPIVRAEGSLIAAQVVFLYVLDALLSWSRGRMWRIGYAPLPIVLSTNLLLWFKDDWFHWQFAMLATGALAKQFVTWNREGRRIHVFNPSAFGQATFAVVLIATGTTRELTWGKEIATSFETPHMLLVIFLLGLVVQHLFRVTLMTLAATATIVAFGLAFHAAYGTWWFVNVNVAAPIFLGLHLLMTDPSTSPRTHVGQVVFGVLYGLGYCVLFRVLDQFEVPTFWDKLLPVPILNLLVPLLDRIGRTGVVGRVDRAWETKWSPRAVNAAHMTCWAALFATMYATGFLTGPHEGNSIAFWKKARREGKPLADHSLVMAAGALAEGAGVGAAFNELGLICVEGEIVDENRAKAAHYFARASELGSPHGAANVVSQFLFRGERRSDEDVERALSLLEGSLAEDRGWMAPYLVASAYEKGRGRPRDPARALALYRRCGEGNLYAYKGIARIALSSGAPGVDLRPIAEVLGMAADAGDVESAWYLAYLHVAGLGVARDETRARALFARACELGDAAACAAAGAAAIPPYAKPVMAVPPFSSAYPVQ